MFSKIGVEFCGVGVRPGGVGVRVGVGFSKIGVELCGVGVGNAGVAHLCCQYIVLTNRVVSSWFLLLRTVRSYF